MFVGCGLLMNERRNRLTEREWMSCCCCWTEWRRLGKDASRLAVFQQQKARQESYGDSQWQERRRWRSADVSDSCHRPDVLFRLAAGWPHWVPVGQRLLQFQRSQVLLWRMPPPRLPRRYFASAVYALLIYSFLFDLCSLIICTCYRRMISS